MVSSLRSRNVSVDFRVPVSFLLPHPRHPLTPSTSQGYSLHLGSGHTSLPRAYQASRLIFGCFWHISGNFILLSNSSSPFTLSKVLNNWYYIAHAHILMRLVTFIYFLRKSFLPVTFLGLKVHCFCFLNAEIVYYFFFSVEEGGEEQKIRDVMA